MKTIETLDGRHAWLDFDEAVLVMGCSESDLHQIIDTGQIEEDAETGRLLIDLDALENSCPEGGETAWMSEDFARDALGVTAAVCSACLDCEDVLSRIGGRNEIEYLVTVPPAQEAA